MKVSELIESLQSMPLDADVCYVWDGAARGDAQVVWLSRAGYVVVADEGDPIYYSEDRPPTAPTSEEDPHWKGPYSVKGLEMMAERKRDLDIFLKNRQKGDGR